jgi:polyhydroxyalkanoate synthase
VIVPPCINKFYILDLQPENSWCAIRSSRAIRCSSFPGATCRPSSATSAGTTTSKGALQALKVVQEICGVDQINALGFCVGGTILRSALAVPGSAGKVRVASLTLLTTLLDFSDSGEIGLPGRRAPRCQAREATIGKGGLLRGRELAQVPSPACAPTT